MNTKTRQHRSLTNEDRRPVIFEVLTERELRRFECQRCQAQTLYNKLVWSGQRIRGWLITPHQDDN
ncbi:hypothetical protein [Vibrio splendidus]|uniref:hypothetical protein n=1 Tax=Vibrio splendidus TaxID=29497 RepID=UPI003D0CC9C6